MGDVLGKTKLLSDCKLDTTLTPNYDEEIRDLAPNVTEADVKATYELLSHLYDLTIQEEA